MFSVYTKEMDYRDIAIPPKLVEIPYPAAEIRKLIRRKCERAVSFEEGEGPAVETDIVILSYEEKGIRKKKHVNIGKGANAGMEQLCLGKRKGDEFAVRKREAKLVYRVESVIRRMIPELTDAMMPLIEPERSISAEAYRQELIHSVEEKAMIKSAAAVFNMILNYCLKQDAFAMNEAEIQTLAGEYYEMFRDYGAQQGLTAEEAIRNAMKNSKQTMTEMEYLEDMAQKELKKAVVCEYFLKKEPWGGKTAEEHQETEGVQEAEGVPEAEGAPEAEGVPETEGIQQATFADLVPALQDQFYEVIFAYVASLIKWKEE